MYPVIPPTSLPAPGPSVDPPEMKMVAQDLESTFLAEMLKSAGFGKQPESFNGGVGEEQFSSFLVRAQADAMVQAGGLGLTELFVKSMLEAENG
ncbi:rod-binding protein [Marinovum sp.]|uniref:rod-binding protein n=1 Tax=Marinovum sp. TaxID=2024839 RepID=UPI003A8D29CF